MSYKKIVKIENSKVKNKRLRVTLNNGDTYDFGQKDGDTYIDEGDKVKRENYWARHMANPVEEYRIKNLVPSASLFSAYLLWGETTNLNQNIRILNNLFK
jgi:hypothetical protein